MNTNVLFIHMNNVDLVNHVDIIKKIFIACIMITSRMIKLLVDRNPKNNILS